MRCVCKWLLVALRCRLVTSRVSCASTAKHRLYDDLKGRATFMEPHNCKYVSVSAHQRLPVCAVACVHTAHAALHAVQ
jgi:hypothetical protein